MPEAAAVPLAESLLVESVAAPARGGFGGTRASFSSLGGGEETGGLARLRLPVSDLTGGEETAAAATLEVLLLRAKPERRRNIPRLFCF